MKSLPAEISNLNALESLKVANNKLVELPLALSSLKRLENLDLSHNRLTTLGPLDLSLMRNLQNLNLQVLAKNHELGAFNQVFLSGFILFLKLYKVYSRV